MTRACWRCGGHDDRDDRSGRSPGPAVAGGRRVPLRLAGVRARADRRQRAVLRPPVRRDPGRDRPDRMDRRRGLPVRPAAAAHLAAAHRRPGGHDGGPAVHRVGGRAGPARRRHADARRRLAGRAGARLGGRRRPAARGDRGADPRASPTSACGRSSTRRRSPARSCCCWRRSVSGTSPGWPAVAEERLQRAVAARGGHPRAGAAGPRHPRLGAPGAGAGPRPRRRPRTARPASWPGWPGSRRRRCGRSWRPGRWTTPATPAALVDLRTLRRAVRLGAGVGGRARPTAVPLPATGGPGDRRRRRRGAGQRRPPRRAGTRGRGCCVEDERRRGDGDASATTAPGIAPGRLAEAADQGRLGVAQSIRGPGHRPRRHGADPVGARRRAPRSSCGCPKLST